MSDHPLEWTLHEFLDRLASSAPTPGGGSVAALTGALAAGLVSMVCQLTLGRKKYADVEEEMRTVLERAEALRKRLQELVEEDIAAYTTLSAAYKLPRETDQQARARHQAIQQALVAATEAPLQIAQAAREVLELAQAVAERGSQMAVSDAGIAGVLGEAAAQAAAFNVWVNLPTSEDTTFKATSEARLLQTLQETSICREQVTAAAKERMG